MRVSKNKCECPFPPRKKLIKKLEIENTKEHLQFGAF